MNPEEKLQEAAKRAIIDLVSVLGTSISTEAKRMRMTRIADDLTQAVEKSRIKKEADVIIDPGFP